MLGKGLTSRPRDRRGKAGEAEDVRNDRGEAPLVGIASEGVNEVLSPARRNSRCTALDRAPRHFSRTDMLSWTHARVTNHHHRALGRLV